MSGHRRHRKLGGNWLQCLNFPSNCLTPRFWRSNIIFLFCFDEGLKCWALLIPEQQQAEHEVTKMLVSRSSPPVILMRKIQVVLSAHTFVNIIWSFFRSLDQVDKPKMVQHAKRSLQPKARMPSLGVAKDMCYFPRLLVLTLSMWDYRNKKQYSTQRKMRCCFV